MTLHITETEDRVEREILVNAPRARVWQALTDSKEFGEWFGARLEGPFAPGQTTRGMNGCHGEDGIPMELKVVRMEPESAFSYTWHPYAIEPGVDYSREEPTLVEFSLEDEAAMGRGCAWWRAVSRKCRKLAGRLHSGSMGTGGKCNSRTSRSMSAVKAAPVRLGTPAMVRRQAPVFAALGDETRLRLLAQLSTGVPCSITELTAGVAISRQAITKHLRVLEGAGLVRGESRGREVRFELEPARLAEAQGYLEEVGSAWEAALGRLRKFLEKTEG